VAYENCEDLLLEAGEEVVLEAISVRRWDDRGWKGVST
jgi:hypothetical protein